MKTSYGPGRVTLPRAISKLGFASRSRAESLVVNGDVKVNGAVERNPHCWVDLVRDRIEVSARTLERRSFRYCMANKPKGFVTTRSDERGARTVFELLEQQSDDLLAVGRLDKESTGLLLFTNDHHFADRVTSPETGLYKTYRVALDQPIRQEDVEALERGVSIRVGGRDVDTRPSLVRRLEGSEIEISISEGKNRQVRRMLEELSYDVIELERIAIGPLRLGGLPVGRVRDLTSEELKSLKDAAQPKQVQSAASGAKPRSKKVLHGHRRITNR